MKKIELGKNVWEADQNSAGVISVSTQGAVQYAISEAYPSYWYTVEGIVVYPVQYSVDHNILWSVQMPFQRSYTLLTIL